MNSKAIQLPLSRSEAALLRAGDVCSLTGPIYTLRDAGHMRLLEELEKRACLPYGLEGQTIFYAGPSPARAGRPFGAIGPTTASRMDFAAPKLYQAGIVATIGKGKRSEDVRRACIENSSLYFVTTGGAAAFLAKCIESSSTLAYHELGTEALRKIEVSHFPVFVGIDSLGNDIYTRDSGFDRAFL